MASSTKAIRGSIKSEEIDRATWVSPFQVVSSYQIEGFGEINMGTIDFGYVFQHKPMFSYGVELAEGEVLAEGDYPFVSAGVVEWEVKRPETESRASYLYIGGSVWIKVVSKKQYKLIVRLSFEGDVFKSPMYIKDAQ